MRINLPLNSCRKVTKSAIQWNLGPSQQVQGDNWPPLAELIAANDLQRFVPRMVFKDLL